MTKRDAQSGENIPREGFGVSPTQTQGEEPEQQLLTQKMPVLFRTTHKTQDLLPGDVSSLITEG